MSRMGKEIRTLVGTSVRSLSRWQVKQMIEWDRLPGAGGFTAAEVAGADKQSLIKCSEEPHRKHFPFAGEDDLADCYK